MQFSSLALFCYQTVESKLHGRTLDQAAALWAQPRVALCMREASVKHRAAPAVFPDYFPFKKALVQQQWGGGGELQKRQGVSLWQPLTSRLHCAIPTCSILKYCHKSPEAVSEELIDKQGYISFKAMVLMQGNNCQETPSEGGSVHLSFAFPGPAGVSSLLHVLPQNVLPSICDIFTSTQTLYKEHLQAQTAEKLKHFWRQEQLCIWTG